MKQLIIENWFVTPAQEFLELPRLVGNIRNHPFYDYEYSTMISLVLGYDKNRDLLICLNRDYVLGDPSSSFSKELPNFKDQFIKNAINLYEKTEEIIVGTLDDSVYADAIKEWMHKENEYFACRTPYVTIAYDLVSNGELGYIKELEQVIHDLNEGVC